MINADSEKRRKTLIRVHLSTAPEAKWSLVLVCMDPINRHPHFVIMYDRLFRRVYRATCTVVDDYVKTCQ